MSNRKKKIIWVITTVIGCATLCLWFIPTDYAYNVSQEREILLGRYTIDGFTFLLLISIVNILLINGIWQNAKDKSPKQKRINLFRFITVTLSVIFGIIIVDVALRLMRSREYTGTPNMFHRVPNRKRQGTVRDIPKTYFSYPRKASGYTDVNYTLTIDKRGFRNITDLESYNIITVGDSFTEGSDVSDEQVWPFLVSQKSGLSVYNLGMSGASPVTIVEALKRYLPELSPGIVICMLYEGNDFRDSNYDKQKLASEKGAFSLHNIFHNSPLRLAVERAMIKYLGPINSDRFSDKAQQIMNNPEHPMYPISWLPTPLPAGPDAKYYDFDVKSLIDHYTTRDSFIDSKGCRFTFEKIHQLKLICDGNDIRLILVYAPDKPHVLAPLLKETVSVDHLYAFMAMKRHNLGEKQQLYDNLLKRINTKESVMENFAEKNNIEFISLTEALRKEISKGQQAYYTYDQHWTPVGHRIVSEVIYNYLESKTPRPKVGKAY